MLTLLPVLTSDHELESFRSFFDSLAHIAKFNVKSFVKTEWGCNGVLRSPESIDFKIHQQGRFHCVIELTPDFRHPLAHDSTYRIKVDYFAHANFFSLNEKMQTMIPLALRYKTAS